MTQELDYLIDDGRGGFEDIDSTTVALPFLRVLQSLSVQLKKSDPAYLPDAEEGMIYNSVENCVYATPLRVVVGRFQHIYTLWRPNRKGFAGYEQAPVVAKKIAEGAIIRNDTGRLVSLDTGNEYSETYCYYVILPDHPEAGTCLLPLSGSQLKEARRWNRLLVNTYIPGTGKKALPHFLCWNIMTPPMRNDKGAWAGFKVEFDSYVGKETLQLVQAERAALPLQDKIDYNGLEAGSESASTFETDF